MLIMKLFTSIVLPGSNYNCKEIKRLNKVKPRLYAGFLL